MNASKILRDLVSSAAPLALLFMGAAHAQSFIDPTMNASDYQTSTYTQTGTVTITNTATGGNPGSALSVAYNTLTASAIDVSSNTFIATAFSFDPGTVAGGYTLDFSIDKFLTYSPANLGVANGQGFLIVQGGQLFIHGVTLSSTVGTFQTASFSSLSENDFVLFIPTVGTDANVHPDFEAGAMQFGFTSSMGVPPGFSVQGLTVYDNFSVSVTTAVPEPGTYALMLAGILGLAVYRRRSGARGCGGASP
jgi:PEP-CTERM motif